MAVATELVTEFSFKGSLNPLKLFSADLAGGIFLIGEFAGAVRDMTLAVADFVDVPLQAAASLENFSRQTGISAQAVQELGFAASVMGSDINAVQTTLEGLQQKIGEASMRGSEDFARLGISVRDSNGRLKEADQVLQEVGGRFRSLGLSLAEQRTFASALGIDASLLQLLNASSGEMAKLRKQAQDLGVLTDKQTEDALNYSNAITTQKFALSGLQNQIAVGLAPELTELAETFTELLLENKDWIIEGVMATVDGIGVMLDTLVRVAPILALIAGGFVAAKIATIGFATVFGGIVSVLTAPITIIAGLLLLIDDLIVAFQGGESVIADFFDSFLGAGATQKFLQDVVDGFNETIDLVLGSLGKVASFFGFGGDEPLIETGQTVSPSGQTNNSVSQQNNINIVTSDPVLAGQTAADSIQGQLRNASDQLNKGGR